MERALGNYNTKTHRGPSCIKHTQLSLSYKMFRHSHCCSEKHTNSDPAQSAPPPWERVRGQQVVTVSVTYHSKHTQIRSRGKDHSKIQTELPTLQNKLYNKL